MIPQDYLERVYAGFLGMNAGIRLGAPVEPVVWTDKRIEQVYGEITEYVKDYTNFAADDDANGPVFFIRALYDDAHNRELQPEDVGKAWLNYGREGIGMFWWGGEGVSTEHTAFLNLKKGMSAPESGSAETNGIVLAEQIGGQIFIDTWGLIFPNQIEKAADYAEKAASVSHDKNGLYGARFMSACIAKAFDANSIEEIIEAGLSTIPSRSTYTAVTKAVIDFYKNNPTEFRKCRQYLEEEWGYDKYTGVCHIIPNAGVCVLALLYGEGDFSRTIEIATMCGWDTDCNAGNVGTILGVFVGIENIPKHYREPINDFIVTSSVSGYLNILDMPSFVKELALLGYKVSNATAPQKLIESVKLGEVFFDFELPGSTHGFRTDNTYRTRLSHSSDHGFESKGSLEVLFDRMVEGDRSKIFYKPFYRRHDFNDERYKPTFAPTAKSGQTVTMKIYLDKWAGEEMLITPYVRNTFNQEEIILDQTILTDQEWNDVQFMIPETEGAFIDEVGFIVESHSPIANRAIGCLYIDNFHIYGGATYSIDFAKQFEEFKCVTPFAHNQGEWHIDDGIMKCISNGDCSSYSGNYYTKDITIETDITPISGVSHGLIFRAQGIKRHYLVGFDGEGKVSLMLNDFGYKRLVTVSFDWEYSQKYQLKLIAKGTNISFSIDGQIVLEHESDHFNQGMFGFGSLEAGEWNISTCNVIEEI